MRGGSLHTEAARLDEPAPLPRVKAAEALGALGLPALGALERALDDGSAMVVRRAITAIGKVGREDNRSARGAGPAGVAVIIGATARLPISSLVNCN
jgi:hypothetical protein